MAVESINHIWQIEIIGDGPVTEQEDEFFSFLFENLYKICESRV